MTDATNDRRKNLHPSPEEIVAARHAAGLTQREAAAIVQVSLRAWQHWEYGKRNMHPALWRLFLIESKRRR